MRVEEGVCEVLKTAVADADDQVWTWCPIPLHRAPRSPEPNEFAPRPSQLTRARHNNGGKTRLQERG